MRAINLQQHQESFAVDGGIVDLILGGHAPDNEDTISCLYDDWRDTLRLRATRRQQFRGAGCSAWRRLQCNSSRKRDGRLWAPCRTSDRNLQERVPGLLGLAAKKVREFGRYETKMKSAQKPKPILSHTPLVLMALIGPIISMF
jgi:hypothetical protein